MLSLALGVPAIAFLLPPVDDGYGKVYEFRSPGAKGDALPMVDLLSQVVMTDRESGDLAIESYRRRFRAAVSKYLDAPWDETVENWMGPPDEAARRADRAERLRSRARMLMDIAEEDWEHANLLDPGGAEDGEQDGEL